MFRDPTRNLLTAFAMAAAAVPTTAIVSDIASAASKPPAANAEKAPKAGGSATAGDVAEFVTPAGKTPNNSADPQPRSGSEGLEPPASPRSDTAPQPAPNDKSNTQGKADANAKPDAKAEPGAGGQRGSAPSEGDAQTNGDSGAQGQDGTPAPAVAKAVVARPVSGHVTVRLPGTATYAPLDEIGEMPVGAVVDAGDGKVRVTAALPGGKRQAGTFWGGKFRVRQARTGLTELELAGELECHAAGKASAAGKRTKRNRLWGQDRSGRFRTRGANSVATVRGTEWLVEDRCSGTLTRVTHGAVVVRDQVRHKTVTVRAGERYLARPKR